MPQQQQHKYLDPDVLSKLGSLDIIARQVVEGVRIGMHRTPLRGISTEFTAYRQYVPGDEIRHIDWKAYARVNRYYVKLFEAETNFVANMLIDSSKSMTFASGNISKLEYAKYMAASLAYLIVNQNDSVGLGIFDNKLRDYVAPKSSTSILLDMSRQLEKVDPQPKTNIGAILEEFANRMSRRGFVILFSDLFGASEDFIEGINHLRFRGHNVVVFHLLDPYEITFPLKGMWKFVGLEGEGDLVTQPKRVRHNYLQELQAFIDRFKVACGKAGADYVLVNTADPIEHVLTGYLLQRSLAARTGR
jgi:uncharacterized protein (DUF58 family)|tara:strand:+ start:526 stop:1437 length:912 start_codon:yes stop_codon:yes gene_type:complete